MSNQKEKALAKKEIYKGKVVTFELYDVECPNGVISQREIVRHHGGVCILAEIDGKIAMEKQYRFPYDDFIFELPAGKLEKDESPYDAGIRELQEEVGLKAERLIDYGQVYPSVGYTDEIIYLYVAEGLSAVERHLDEDENIDIVFVEKSELKKMLDNNQIKDAKTQILLLKYLLKEN